MAVSTGTQADLLWTASYETSGEEQSKIILYLLRQ